MNVQTKSKQAPPVAGMSDPIEPAPTGWDVLKIVGFVALVGVLAGAALIDHQWAKKLGHL